VWRATIKTMPPERIRAGAVGLSNRSLWVFRVLEIGFVTGVDIVYPAIFALLQYSLKSDRFKAFSDGEF
jgi:hypothetical protein